MERDPRLSLVIPAYNEEVYLPVLLDSVDLTRFRMAYDQLRQHFTSSRASKDYLQILQYAARLSESAVNTVLGQLLRSGELPTLGAVEVLLQLSETPPLEDVHIDEVELTAY